MFKFLQHTECNFTTLLSLIPCLFQGVCLCNCRPSCLLVRMIKKWTTFLIRQWVEFVIYFRTNCKRQSLQYVIVIAREPHYHYDTEPCYRSQRCIVCEASTHTSWMWNSTPVTDSDSSVSDQKRRRLNVAEHACSCFLSLLSFFIKTPFKDKRHWCNTSQSGSCRSSVAWLTRPPLI